MVSYAAMPLVAEKKNGRAAYGTSTLLQRWCSRKTRSGSTAAALRLGGVLAVSKRWL